MENMRPISLTSCVGKVAERMVLKRLQADLDKTGQMPAMMYGFRQHLSTQDVMIQRSELVVKQAMKTAPRAILALDLKGAFDNVSHGSVLENLGRTRCGRHTFGYIKDFFTKRTATIRIGEEKSQAVELRDRGSDGWMEGVLQRAVETVHGYAKSCGLGCAPQKSELLNVQPGRPKKQAPPSVTVTVDGRQIIPTEQIRILGLLLRGDGKASAVITKIKHSTEQIADRKALDTAMRKATKIAMGLPMYSSTKRLMDMATLNTTDELIEAHLSNQRVHLSRTEHGRIVLHKI
ncbi:uncharacterized protein LOC144168488 [Haemaphysalis longicornis]